LVRPATVGFDDSEQEKTEGLNVVCQPGGDEQEINAQFGSRISHFLLALDGVAIKNKPVRFPIIMQGVQKVLIPRFELFKKLYQSFAEYFLMYSVTQVTR
jgi:hypothetical protein